MNNTDPPKYKINDNLQTLKGMGAICSAAVQSVGQEQQQTTSSQPMKTGRSSMPLSCGSADTSLLPTIPVWTINVYMLLFFLTSH